MASSVRYQHVPRPSKTPFKEWIPFFNDSYALSCNQGEFYRPDLLDFVFSSSPTPPPSPLPTSLLAAHGTFMAQCWTESLSKCMFTPASFDLPMSKDACASVPDLASHSDDDTSTVMSDDDSSMSSLLTSDDDILSFKSSNAYSLSTSLDEISDDVVQALLQLPTERVTLNPTFKPHHDMDDSHFLRAARRSLSQGLDPLKVFQLLIDSGCSVSCSGFNEDFHGQLAIGNFGNVNTANGQAKIEGFGILRWDVISTDGNRRTILVPGYYSPSVKMRLLSPQDYCRYHHFDPTVAQYRGSSDWMSIDVVHLRTRPHASAEVSCALNI